MTRETEDNLRRCSGRDYDMIIQALDDLIVFQADRAAAYGMTSEKIRELWYDNDSAREYLAAELIRDVFDNEQLPFVRHFNDWLQLLYCVTCNGDCMTGCRYREELATKAPGIARRLFPVHS